MHKILKIDDLVISDHSYLRVKYNCYHFMEYTSGGGYSASPANDLISNFKKGLQHKDSAAWKYKGIAIDKVVDLFSGSLPSFVDLKSVTLVPIPPSKTKGNPLHDDRMLQCLKKFANKYGADVQELILVNEDMEPVHKSERRPTPSELESNLRLDTELIKQAKPIIILFDDVVTTGCHYVACRNLILRAMPEKTIAGIFIARRSIPIEENDE